MRDFLLGHIKNFRYERKCRIDTLTKEEVESVLKFHPAIFREIYRERRVNNIYLDSFDLAHYFDNVNGVSRRLKVRIRWYDDTFGFIKNPVLELKLKHNMHIGKISYPLKSFTVDKGFSIKELRQAIKDSRVHPDLVSYLVSLRLVFLNSYIRRYFLSADQKYRVTVDSDTRIYKLAPHHNEFLCSSSNSDEIILEIKYNRPDDEGIDRITNHFPFRLTRNSKYVNAVSELYAW